MTALDHASQTHKVLAKTGPSTHDPGYNLFKDWIYKLFLSYFNATNTFFDFLIVRIIRLVLEKRITNQVIFGFRPQMKGYCAIR